jgi:hypothetical protein
MATLNIGNLTRNQIRERLGDLAISDSDLGCYINKEVIYMDDWDIGKAMVIPLPNPVLVREDGSFCGEFAIAYPPHKEVWNLYAMLTRFDELEEAICLVTMDNIPLVDLERVLDTLTDKLNN